MRNDYPIFVLCERAACLPDNVESYQAEHTCKPTLHRNRQLIVFENK